MPVPSNYPIPVEWQNGQGHPRYLQLLSYMRDLHIRKGGDYSGQERDSLTNLRTSADLGVPPHVGVLVRISDKWERIKTLVRESRDPLVTDETIIDTMFDAAAYFLLDIILYEEARDVESARRGQQHLAQSERASGRDGTPSAGAEADGTTGFASEAVLHLTAPQASDPPAPRDSDGTTSTGPFGIPADPGYMGYGSSRKVQTPET